MAHAACLLLALALVQSTEPPPPSATPAAAPQATPTTPAATPAAPSKPADKARPDTNPEVILYLKDGTVFQGLLLSEDQEKFVLEIAGISATFAADKVERVRTLPPVLERYKELRNATAETDIEQRIGLIRWLADRKQVEIALAEAELLLEKNPKHIGVRKVTEDLRARVDLLIKTAQPAPADKPQPDELVPDDGRISTREFPFLTDAQVAVLKVYEVDLSARPRIIFPREAVSRMLEEYASNPLVPASRDGKDAILRQDPVENVQLMFRLRARDYYEKVKVVDQPESMRRFRDDVQRITLLSGCATSQCHGGREAGRLVLSTYRPNNDTTLYTNFYNLTKFRTAMGLPLIDWESPQQSLLLQLAYPPEISRYRHPPVIKEGRNVWKPALTGPEDRRAKAIIDWVASAYRPRPDYTLDYTPYRPFTPPTPAPGKEGSQAEPVTR